MTESEFPLDRRSMPEKSEAEIEFDFPYLKIPNGAPDSEPDRYGISSIWGEPTEETLDTFFKDHPEATDRLLYCPEVNVDELDSWGMFGYEPGYIFIVSRIYEGNKNLADKVFLPTAMGNPLETPSGITIMQYPHYDFFPVHKYRTQILKESDTPRTYAYINRMLNTPKPGK